MLHRMIKQPEIDTPKYQYLDSDGNPRITYQPMPDNMNMMNDSMHQRRTDEMADMDREAQELGLLD